MGKELKATFAFLVLPQQELKDFYANTIAKEVDSILKLAETEHSFSRFFLYLEAHSDRHLSIGSLRRVHTYEGNSAQVTLQEIQVNLEGKLVEENKARQEPGHESYTPKSILTVDTCVIVMGRREFCAALAAAHMYEVVPLRLKLVDMVVKICGLEPYTGRPSMLTTDLLIVSVSPDIRSELTYNIRWWADNCLAPKIASDPMELIIARQRENQ